MEPLRPVEGLLTPPRGARIGKRSWDAGMEHIIPTPDSVCLMIGARVGSPVLR
jgi:hypothetical protein